MASDNIFKIHTPHGTPSALVLDSPHSGCIFPADFGAAVSVEQLRTAEDVDVNDLYAAAPSHGATLLEACFPRSYIDPNRAAGDVDLDLLDGPWPHHYAPSGKAKIGKALVWRSLDDGTPIYAGRLRSETVMHRITHYLQPYQQALKELLDAAHARHGRVYHINCHSMEAVAGVMGEGGAGNRRADVVLGDRDGTTCEGAFTEHVAAFFRSRGYSVAINDPYKGVELVRMYSNPQTRRHSLQVEVNKGLYLQDGTRERSAGYARLQTDLGDLVRDLVRFAA